MYERKELPYARNEAWKKKFKKERRNVWVVQRVESLMESFNVDLQRACEGLGITVEEYNEEKENIQLRDAGDA